MILLAQVIAAAGAAWTCYLYPTAALGLASAASLLGLFCVLTGRDREVT